MSLLLDSQYPRIGVGVIILRGKKVLLGRRKGPRSAGSYGLPGGFLENNETFEECAKREILEETGLENLSLYPFALIGGYGDNLRYIDIIFYAEHKGKEPVAQETDRVEIWEWFNIYNLPSPLYQPTKLALGHFLPNYQYHKVNLFLQRYLPRKNKTIVYIDAKFFY